MSAREKSSGGTGFWTRVGLTLGLVMAGVLAVAVVIGVTELFSRPGFRKRFDLTLEGRNTLDQTSRDVLQQLEGEISIDIFFRTEDAPLTAAAGEAQERTFEFLLLLRENASDKVRLQNHQLPQDAVRAQARMRELDVPTTQTVVVSRGTKREVLHLKGDLAAFDFGNPDPGNYRPPRLVAFNGESAIIGALLKVMDEDRPKILFSAGHGERDLYGDEGRELGRLYNLLVADGFEPRRWEGDLDEPLADDVAALVILAPREPFSAREADELRAFIGAGGRLIFAPDRVTRGGEDSVPEVLEDYGIELLDGLVARPYLDANGIPRAGSARCATIQIDPGGMSTRHPITAPLYRGGRRVTLVESRAFQRGEAPSNSTLLDLLRSTELTWLDLPDARGEHQFQFDVGAEAKGPFRLGLSLSMQPTLAVPAARSRGSDDHESRIITLGSAEIFTNALLDANRDFLLNTFNWIASREYKVRVQPKSNERRVLPIGEDRRMAKLNFVAVLGLPLATFLAGVLVFWMRRR